MQKLRSAQIGPTKLMSNMSGALVPLLALFFASFGMISPAWSQSREAEIVYFNQLAAIADTPRWKAEIAACYTNFGTRMTIAMKQYLRDEIAAAESKQKAASFQELYAQVDGFYPLLYKAQCVERLWTIVWSPANANGEIENINGGDKYRPQRPVRGRQGYGNQWYHYPTQEISEYTNDLTEKAWDARSRAFRLSMTDKAFDDPTARYKNCVENLPSCSKSDRLDYYRKVVARWAAMETSFAETFDPKSTSRIEAESQFDQRYFDRSLYKAVGGN